MEEAEVETDYKKV